MKSFIKIIIYNCLIVSLIFVISGCSMENPLDKTVNYLNSMIKILEDNKNNVSKAAEELKKYVTRQEIEFKKLSKDLEYYLEDLKDQSIVESYSNKLSAMAARLQALSEKYPGLLSNSKIADAFLPFENTFVWIK